MAGRILDICARSLFRTVCCVVAEGNETATSFLDRLGFTPADRVTQRIR
jgi:ribosomal protein S18 acetylase RimI-like enzyme